MTADLRWLWSRLTANYWFFPALFAIAAAALAFWMIYLDQTGRGAFLNDVRWLIPARPSGASNMLTVIAGSMIGVASTVFSITIAAVAYASGNYGPRLLTNFMEDRGNQLSLATFIGTFVYALIVLRSVRAEDEVPADAAEAAATALPGFVPQLSLLAAFALMGLSVGVLVFFLNHIPASIRINSVLKGIGRRLLAHIDKSYPPTSGRADAEPDRAGPPVHASATGYIQIIDFDELRKAAERAGVRLALVIRTGDFVHPGMELLHVCTGEATDELARKVRAAFSIGPSRSPEQDPQFLIDELVEIAVRALSPGINDPFTAITAVHWLGAATAELGRRDLRERIGDPAMGEACVLPLPDDFEHFLARGFGAVRSAVATSRAAALVMLDTLVNVASTLDDESRKALIRREAARLLEQAREALRGPDFEEVEARFVFSDRKLA